MSSSNQPYGTRAGGGGHGDVFTAPEVVCYMLDLVDYVPSRDLSSVDILEPACGNGEFIVEIARRLISSAHRFGFDAQEAFMNHVRAYDIDEAKLEVCRARLAEVGIDPKRSIQLADFLRTDVAPADIIVGNPPYVRYENLPADMVNFCRAAFRTFHYRADLYIPFFEKSLLALREGGKHCFICSNRWLKNEYGRKLRDLISRGFQLEMIVNLEKANAFQEDVLAYPAITLIQNAMPTATFSYAESAEATTLSSLTMQRHPMPKGEDWTEAFVGAGTSVAGLTIEQQGFKIGIGVATGADSVFISRELPSQVEAELILPSIGSRDLRGDKMQWLGEYVLNPYKPNGELINLSDYPRAKEYLERHRERLSCRHVARKHPARWYKTIDRITPSLLHQPKVLLPDMSGNSYIFVDDGHYYPMHNLYYITGASSLQLRVLAAMLMSDFVREQLASVTNQMNGGFPRWQSQHLRKLRLPRIADISEEDVQELLNDYEHKDIVAINSHVGEIVRKSALLPRKYEQPVQQQLLFTR